MNDNIKKLYLQSVLNDVITLVISGGVLQTFMLEYGMGERNVSLAVAVYQVSEAVSMLLFSGRLEREKRILKAYVRLLLLLLPMIVCMLVVSLTGGKEPEKAFIAMLITGAITYGGVGVTGALAYKIPYLLIDMKEYGRVIGMQGTISGCTCMVLSLGMSFLLKKTSYRTAAPFFPLAAILALTVLIFNMNSVKKVADPPVTESGKIDLFRYRPFVLTFFPNLARGIGGGILGIMTTVGYHAGIIDSVSATYMVFITYATSMLGCFIFSRVSRFGHDGAVILFCGVFMCILMPFMVAKNSLVLFLAIYGACQLLRATIDIAAPSALAKVIDYRAVVQCSAWRLALYMLGAAVSSYAALPLMDRFGYTAVLSVCGLLHLIMGIGYFIVTERKEV